MNDAKQTRALSRILGGTVLGSTGALVATNFFPNGVVPATMPILAGGVPPALPSRRSAAMWGPMRNAYNVGQLNKYSNWRGTARIPYSHAYRTRRAYLGHVLRQFRNRARNAAVRFTKSIGGRFGPPGIRRYRYGRDRYTKRVKKRGKASRKRYGRYIAAVRYKNVRRTRMRTRRYTRRRRNVTGRKRRCRR